MKKILLTSTFAFSLLMSASNPSNKYSYELTPFAAGILTDSKSGLEDDGFYRNYYNAGISLGKNLKDFFLDQIEIGFIRSDSLDYENKSYGNTNINRTYLNLIKKFALTGKLSTYGLAGVGFQDVTNETIKHEDSPFFNYGLGLRYDIPYYGIAIKSDVRHLFATKNSQNSVMYTLGLAMPLGKEANEKITPITPKVEEPEKKLIDGDDDNDGVLNSKDLCPNTRAGAKVDENGCELDDDNDGVVNRLDKCPKTSPGVKVNKDGCVATVNLKINFDYNSAKISNKYNEDLKNFSIMLKEDTSLTAVIEAHSDSIGSNKYNQKLSEKRALSAVNKLKEYKIDTARLKSIGYGETQPIASNDSEEGRAQNRRVIGYVNK